MIRLDELMALRKVIELRSFSRAAESLGLSQPAVSLQIKSLESEYGVELLHRDGFEIMPTEGGEIVYDFACQMLNLYENSRQQIRELMGSAGGRLIIGSSSGPGEYLLPLILGQFKAEHPQVEISLRVGDSKEIIDQIVQHRLELGVVGSRRRDRHLNFETFINDQLVLVVYPTHPWASRKSISYKELLQVPLILQQHGSGATEALYQALSEYDLNLNDLNITMELGLQDSTKAAVRAGLGITIISKLGVIQELKEGVLIEIPVEGLELGRDFYSVYRRTSPLTQLARALLVFAQQQVEQVLH